MSLAKSNNTAKESGHDDDHYRRVRVFNIAFIILDWLHDGSQPEQNKQLATIIANLLVPPKSMTETLWKASEVGVKLCFLLSWRSRSASRNSGNAVMAASGFWQCGWPESRSKPVKASYE